MYDVAKENVLISCAFTAQLVCVFVFAYVISYEACHENQSMPWVQNKGANQHAHPCIRISAFLICSNGYYADRAVQPYKMARGLAFKK